MAICLSAFVSVRADVRLPDILGNSMVLQQKQKVPIWGTAEVGETVSVSFQKQKYTVAADQKGNWRVNLNPLKSSFEPQTLIVEGKNRIELKDILIGEVWLVSGQSNMQWTLFQSNDGAAEVSRANHPQLRLFNVSREVAFKRKQGKLGEWKICNPDSVKDFSGAGYYFGLELQKVLKVPVGLINSSYGGSQAEAWTPVEYLKNNSELIATVERTKVWADEREQVRNDYSAAIEKWKNDSEKQKSAGVKPSPSPGVPDALRDYRIASSIYDGMIEPLMPLRFAARRYQGESNEAQPTI